MTTQSAFHEANPYSTAYSQGGTVTYPNGDGSTNGKFIYIELSDQAAKYNYGAKYSLFDSGQATLDSTTSFDKLAVQEYKVNAFVPFEDKIKGCDT